MVGASTGRRFGLNVAYESPPQSAPREVGRVASVRRRILPAPLQRYVREMERRFSIAIKDSIQFLALRSCAQLQIPHTFTVLAASRHQGRVPRYVNVESRADSSNALDRYVPAMSVHHRLCYRHSEAGSVRLPERDKWFENAGK